MKLITSNQQKISEFRTHLPAMEFIKLKNEAPEILSLPVDVIRHKAKEIADKNKELTSFIVEDSVFCQYGKNFIDIQYSHEDVSEGRCQWISYIALVENDNVSIYSSKIIGDLKNNKDKPLSDSFYINGKSLREVLNSSERENLPRFKNLTKILNKEIPKFQYKLSEIKDWNGEFQ